jgi:pimeloyl-ACP methyl ester carboxylesterase
MTLADTGNIKRTHATVTVQDGVRLRYRESGSEDGQPILFLHGYTDSSLSFRRLLPHVPAGYRILVPDQRGHGDSDKPAEGYRRSDFAADAVALLDALGIGRVTIVGHSLGSLTAQRIAADDPHRVSGLVLIGSAPGAATNAGLLDLKTAILALEEAPDRAFIHEFQTSTVATPLPEDFLEAVVDESAKVPLGVWREALADLVDARSDVALDAIHTPTLVIWGEQDAVFSRADQSALVDGIAGASLRTYDATGHAPHWERPEVTGRDLGDFLRDRVGAGAEAVAGHR